MLQMDQEQQQGQPWGHDDDDNNMMGSFLNTNILFVLPFYLREGPQASAYPDIDMGREISQTCVIESYACKRQEQAWVHPTQPLCNIASQTPMPAKKYSGIRPASYERRTPAQDGCRNRSMAILPLTLLLL